MFRRLFFSFIVALLSVSAYGQKPTTQAAPKDTVELIQLTGIVITDSLRRVPFTRVADQSTRRGTIADYFGYFALVVHPGDTIEFACLGYKRKTYIVPDTLSEKEISLVQVMHEDTIQMDPVEVYPWPSKEQFATVFVNMDLPDDDLRRAQKRLSPQEMAFVGALLASDGTSSYSAYRIEQYQDLYTRGQSPVNNLLNPAAWSDFIKGIGTGRYQISQ
ncbi:hypothetical protein OAV92_02180 [Crocinitomicaceae bacterium]|nr:hypothetical protein [Crocinitomicaceae bacterium]